MTKHQSCLGNPKGFYLFLVEFGKTNDILNVKLVQCIFDLLSEKNKILIISILTHYLAKSSVGLLSGREIIHVFHEQKVMGSNFPSVQCVSLYKT